MIFFVITCHIFCLFCHFKVSANVLRLGEGGVFGAANCRLAVKLINALNFWLPRHPLFWQAAVSGNNYFSFKSLRYFNNVSSLSWFCSVIKLDFNSGWSSRRARIFFLLSNILCPSDML